MSKILNFEEIKKETEKEEKKALKMTLYNPAGVDLDYNCVRWSDAREYLMWTYDDPELCAQILKRLEAGLSYVDRESNGYYTVYTAAPVSVMPDSLDYLCSLFYN